MKLLVIINDSVNGFRQLQATGVMPSLKRRAVSVQLTREQCVQIATLDGKDTDK